MAYEMSPTIYFIFIARDAIGRRADETMIDAGMRYRPANAYIHEMARWRDYV